MKAILQALSISDRYERKARLLPGLIVASPAALTAAALSAGSLSWYEVLGIGVGAEAILAFVMGYLARAHGKTAEVCLWAKWGGPPTTRWLRPTDESRSEQQKSKWRGAIKRLTGLAIPASVSAERTEADIDKVIKDATEQVRYQLRDRPEAAILRIHNEDYGQARNLHGLRWHWVIIAALSFAICVMLLILGQGPWLALGLSGGSLLIALLISRESEEHVRRCADRYGESFFAGLLMYDEAKAKADEKPKPAEVGH
jgi:hypothetical protein